MPSGGICLRRSLYTNDFTSTSRRKHRYIHVALGLYAQAYRLYTGPSRLVLGEALIRSEPCARYPQLKASSRAWPASTGGNADAYRSAPSNGYLLPLVMGGIDSNRLWAILALRAHCVRPNSLSRTCEPRQENSKPNNQPHYPKDWCSQATNQDRNSIGEATPSSKAPSVASRPSPPPTKKGPGRGV
jgi:hypothetical protein